MLVPTTPFENLSIFESHVQQLIDVAKEIKELRTRPPLSGEALQALQAETSTRVNSLLETRAGVELSYYTTERNITAQRLQSISARSRTAAAELDDIHNQIRAKSKAVTGSALSLVSKSAGIPIDLGQIANGGSLRSSLMAAAVAAAASPEFAASVSSANETLGSVVSTIQEGKKLYGEVQNGTKTIEAVRDAVRNPTIESLERLGGQLASHSDPATQRRWREIVAASRPVELLINNARSGTPLRDAISVALREAGVAIPQGDLSEAQLKGLVRARVADLESALDSELRALATESINSLAAPSQEAIRQKICRHPAIMIVQDGRNDCLTTVDRAKLALALAAIARDPANREFADKLRNRFRDRYPDSANTNISEISVEALLGAVDGRLSAVKQQLNERLNSIFDRSVQALPEQQKQVVLDQLARQNMAAAYMSEVSSNSPSIAATGTAVRALGASGGGEIDPAAAALAIAGAIFPNVAMAQLAVSMVAGLQEIDILAAQANRKADEIRELLVEEVHLQGALRSINLSAELAALDARIATEQRRGALAAYALIRDREREAAEAQRGQLALALFKSALAFYLAEKCREDYELLSLSYERWSGALQFKADYLRAEVEIVPEVRRLALDPYIQLHKWLREDRSLESRRTDIELMAAHWSAVRTLVKDFFSRSSRNGSISLEGGGLGSVGSVDVDLSKLVSDAEWERFRDWQRRRGRNADGRLSAYEMPVIIRPQNRDASQDNESFRFALADGLRLVALRAGRLMGNRNAPTSTDKIRITHGGFAFVPIYDPSQDRYQFVKEIYRPTAIEAVWDANESFLLDRWRAGYRRQGVEGYGLFTTLVIRFEAESGNFTMRDLRLRFWRQYVALPVSRPSSPSARVLIKLGNGTSIDVNADAFQEFTSSAVSEESILRELLGADRVVEVPRSTNVRPPERRNND
jgi:hypothetical protein